MAALLERPLFELIPLRDALDRAESLPPGAGDDGHGVAHATGSSRRSSCAKG